MSIRSGVIKVKVSRDAREHRRVSFLTDRLGEMFELSSWYRPTLYPAIRPEDLRDTYRASSFVHRFSLEFHEWRQVLLELRVDVEHGALGSHADHHVLLGALAHSVGVRQLRRPQKQLSVPGVRGRHYCFLPGPIPIPDTLDAQHDPIFTQIQAQGLLNTLDFNGVKWSSLIQYAGQQSPTVDLTQKGYKAELQEWLATEKVLAYAVRDISDAQDQSSVSPAAAVPPARAKPSRSTSSDRGASNPPSPVSSKAASASNSPVATATPPKTDFSNRKGVQPRSLEDALERLKAVEKEIKSNGYQRKYTMDEVQKMADAGNVPKERYHVRMMEVAYLARGESAGSFGGPLETISGKVTKYWSTTFDQTEDNDLRAELHCLASGIPLDETKSYVLVIIDTEKAKPLTGVETMVPTFKNLSDFANREIKEFPASVTDGVMNEAFQKQYAKHHDEAVKSKFLEDKWDKDSEGFAEYLNQAGVTGKEADLLANRFAMHHALGNNAEFLGNGMTKQMAAAPDSAFKDVEKGRPFAMVETFNIERKPTNLDQLLAAGAITAIRLR